jgi:AcrR family transcriptional regulator
MARPSKRTARKAQLVQAAMQTIQQRGFDGLRIRDVANVAGVSTATVHYYFDDLDGLLTEVHALATERFFTERLAAIALHDDARDKMVEMIRRGMPQAADDATTVALYHIDNAKRADPVRAQLGTRLFERQVMLYHGILELGCSQDYFAITDDTIDVAQNLVGLEDAYCMHIIEGNTSLPYERCVELMLSYARLATGCTDLGAPEPASRGRR